MQKYKIIPIPTFHALGNIHQQEKFWHRITEIRSLSFILWGKNIVSKPSEVLRCSGYLAVPSSQAVTRDKLARVSQLAYPGKLDKLILVNGPDLLLAPYHSPKYHIPPKTLRAQSHRGLMAQRMFIWDGNCPA